MPAAELHSVWATIKPGLEITAKRAPGNWIPEDIYSELKTGGAVLHLAIIDMYCRGFIVSKTFESFDGKVLLVWIGYSNDTTGDLLSDNIEDVMTWARNINAVRVQFQSPRPGFEKIAPSIGFTKTQVVYERDV